MAKKRGPFQTFGIKVVDALKLGVPARDSYHYLKYVVDRRAVARNRRFIKGRKPGEPAFPPPKLIYRVAGHFDIEQYYRSGLWCADFITATLRKNGSDINDLPAILDFGCGCGRVSRHWKGLTGPALYGCDHQRPLVRWCRKNLAFGRFTQNRLMSSLSYPNGAFAFVYAISVFPHLDEQGQHFWIGELSRVLKEGGLLLITVHGTTRMAELTAEEPRRFQAGEPIFRQERYSGANICAVYHPQTYVLDIFGRKFSFVDFLPGGALDADQDAYLFRKA